MKKKNIQKHTKVQNFEPCENQIINKRQVIPIGEWLQAEAHLTKGFAFRPGWHTTAKPEAPHLSMRGRVWMKVEIEEYTELNRPGAQGGLWYLANRMRIVGTI